MKKNTPKMKPPAGLTPYEISYWLALVENCDALKLLDQQDSQLFELAAKAAGEYQVARESFMEHGPTIMNGGDRAASS